MLEKYYKQIIEKSPIGMACHKIICDAAGKPYDYEFLEVNSAFETLTGLKGSEIIGKRVTKVLPDISKDEFDWIGFYGDVALNGGEKEIEQYSKDLNKWYRIFVFSPERFYFAVIIGDISEQMIQLETYQNMAVMSEEFLQMGEDELDYQKITDEFLKISGAKYAVFNLFDENGESFTTKAFSGNKRIIKKAIDLLGFKIEGKKWEKDPVRAEKIKDNMITRFPSIQGIAAGVIPKSIIALVENTFKVGQVVLVKITINNVMLGDFTLVMAKGEVFDRDTIAELFTRQLGLVMDRARAQAEIKETKEYFEIIFSTTPDASVITRMSDGQIEDVNDGFTFHFGFTKEDVVGKNIHMILKDNLPDRQKMIDELVKNQYYLNDSTNFRRKDESVFNGIFASKMLSYKGIKYIYSSIRDITQQRQTEEALSESREKYRRLIRNSNDIIFTLNLDGNISLISPAGALQIGFTEEEVIGNSFENFVHPDDKDRVMEVINRVIFEGEREKNIEYRVKHKDGLWRWHSSSAAPQKDDTGHIIGLEGIARDITQRKNSEDEIQFMSYHDHLTGLYNRRYFDEAMNSLNEEKYFPLTLIMADVNGLKLTNDVFGHKAGDMLLERVAEIIKNECRSTDIVARIGGDEFVVFLPETDAKNANIIISRINQSIKNETICNVAMSISMGYAVKNNLVESMNDIFIKAENEMYKQKLSESQNIKDKTIDLVLKTLYKKNNREMLHSKRVSSLSASIASKIEEIDEEGVSRIKTAALLHDIGKIGVQDEILDNTAALTDDERAEVERHSEIGYRILSSVKELSEIAEYVLDQHERWDGKGYPRGLKGKDISLQARIIAIADAFDVMTSDLSYKKKLSEKEAVKEIIRCSGTQFDPEVARVFVEKVLNEKWD